MSAAALSITAGLYLIATWDYFTLINRPWMAGVFICYACANLCLLMVVANDPLCRYCTGFRA